jgi:hypothetical protein
MFILSIMNITIKFKLVGRAYVGTHFEFIKHKEHVEMYHGLFGDMGLCELYVHYSSLM